MQPKPEDADEVLEIGRKAAEYLMNSHYPAGTPFEFFPPTYEGEQKVKHASEDVLMMIYPAEAAEAYLDLYDVTNEQKYFDAAKRIAGTYVKTQLENGAWYLLVDVHTAKPEKENLCIPTVIINFFDRLKRQYGIQNFEKSKQRAIEFVMTGPMRSFNWQGQFEDCGPPAAYKNQSRQEVCQFATYLLDYSQGQHESIQLAEELLRFAEDQFVVWEVAKEHTPLPGPKAGKEAKRDQSAWLTPTVLEQYNYYVPVCRSMGMLIAAYQKAYEGI